MEQVPLIPLLTAQDLELTGRILLSFALGAVVGFERERLRRPAGLRTHMLVAAGATAFTVASIYGFGGAAQSDPARVAAQVVTGVGFLGAGTIFRTQSRVRGLTTASSIWVVAAIGMLVGAGLYWLAIVTTLLGGLTLYAVKLPERRIRLGEPSIVPDEDEGD